MQRAFRYLFALLVSFIGGFAPANEPSSSGNISIELNAADPHENGCTLTFLITNGFAQAMDRVIYETVLFDRSGQVDRLTLFDFGALPSERPRVRQFAVPDLTCDELGRVLFNGASTCEGDGLPPSACDAGFTPSSRIEVEVIG
ncbi:hypothetical protein [Roseobacter weihaiensis]|uniref:hypothetical protein n=1 Tax=Roseobacter weihaiensis TaxID=2763262 RepID=UPI001D0AE2F0|nr:hypothetical protein [Roseobacter sp. H9]